MAPPIKAGVKAAKKVAEGLESLFKNADLAKAPAVPQSSVVRYDPPRGMSARVEALLKNRGAYNRVAERATNELTNPEAVHWYNMEPLRLEFVQKLGEKEGTAAFNRYIDLVAATSAGARTPDNLRIASYYMTEGAKGSPVAVPIKGSGYGHKAQNLHNKNANEILAGGGLDPLAHPKRFSFAENLKGNLQPVTVDKHNIRQWAMESRDPEWLALQLEDRMAGAPAFWKESKHGPWTPESFSPRAFYEQNKPRWDDLPPTWFEGAPKKNEYGALEALNQRLAKDVGLEPAEAQAVQWLASGPKTGLGSPPKAMLSTLDEVLRNRAAVRGETPREVLDQMILGQRALGMVPAVPGVQYLLDDEPQR
jgi:hypothetical protein